MKRLLFILLFNYFSGCLLPNTIFAQTAEADTMVAKCFGAYKATASNGSSEDCFNILNSCLKANKAAFERNAKACNALAFYYWIGLGTIKDEDKAFVLMNKAAILGDTNSIYMVGQFYNDGTGVKKNSKEALKWLKMAAAKAYVPAIVRLGCMYMEAEGVKRDPKEAVKYFREAAEQQDVSAYYYLGRAFMEGEGVSKDTYEGFKLYRKAAEGKYADAYSEVAYCYAMGLGVQKDDVKSCEWGQKAINEPVNAGGYFFTALCYRDGLCGKTPNQQKYAKYLADAGEMGDKHAKHILFEQMLERQEQNRAAAAAERAVAQAAENARYEAERERYEGSSAGNKNVTMDGLVSYIKQSAPQQGYRRIREEGKVEGGAKYAYDFGGSYKFMVILIIPYAVTNRSPGIRVEHFDYKGNNDYGYKSDFTNVTQYANMTMVKLTFSTPIGDEKKYEFRPTDGGYFMVISN